MSDEKLYAQAEVDEMIEDAEESAREECYQQVEDAERDLAAAEEEIEVLKASLNMFCEDIVGLIYQRMLCNDETLREALDSVCRKNGTRIPAELNTLIDRSEARIAITRE